jgi:hypothetical protein
MFSEGFSALEKRRDISQRTIQSGVTAYSYDRFAHFFLNLNLRCRVWQPAADYNGCLAPFKLKKSVPNGHYCLQRTQPEGT